MVPTNVDIVPEGPPLPPPPSGRPTSPPPTAPPTSTPPTGPPTSTPLGFRQQPGEPSGDNEPGAPWWRRWWAIAIAAFLALGVVGAALGLGNDDEAEQSSATSPDVTESPDQPAATDTPPQTDDLAEPDPPETASTPTTAEAGTPTTTSSPLAPLGQSPGSPLPMGDPALSVFTYEESFSNAAWEGQLLGLVETGTNEFNDGQGRCVVLIGTITPTKTDGAVSSGYNTPNFSLIAGGRLIESGVVECDTDAIETAGYGWILDAGVTVGTTYPFYSEFFLEAPDAEVVLEAVVAGNPSGSDAFYFEPTVIPDIPQPDIASQESGRDLTPTGDPAVSGFMYQESFSDAAWEGLPLGLVETGTGQFNPNTGRCLVLVGEITPTSAEGAVSSGFATPAFGLIVDGQLVDSGAGDCDTGALESAGFEWILDAEVTIGTPYPFFVEFFLEGADPSTSIEAIVLGNAADEGALYYEPTILGEIPQS